MQLRCRLRGQLRKQVRLSRSRKRQKPFPEINSKAANVGHHGVIPQPGGNAGSSSMEDTKAVRANQAAPRDWAQAYLLDSADVKRQVAANCLDSILSAAEIISNAFRNGNKVLLCGNGGSAADCQHMAAEFVGVLSKDFKRAGLPAIALTTDTSFITAFANDYGYEGVFERQGKTPGKPGDVPIAVSTRGNAKNNIPAVSAATQKMIRTIAMTGNGGML